MTKWPGILNTYLVDKNKCIYTFARTVFNILNRNKTRGYQESTIAHLINLIYYYLINYLHIIQLKGHNSYGSFFFFFQISLVWCKVFNATFDNISDISWRHFILDNRLLRICPVKTCETTNLKDLIDVFYILTMRNYEKRFDFGQCLIFISFAQLSIIFHFLKFGTHQLTYVPPLIVLKVYIN